MSGGARGRPKPLETGFQEAVGTLKIDDFGRRKSDFGPILADFGPDFDPDLVAGLNRPWPASRPSPPAASRRRPPPAALPPRSVTRKDIYLRKDILMVVYLLVYYMVV